MLVRLLGLLIAGNGVPDAIGSRPNVTCLGPIDDFDEVRRLMARSRIVLNATNVQPGGSHERVWFAMAEGAVVLADPSTFLRGDFTPGDSFLELPKSPRIGNSLEYLTDLVRDTSALRAIADRAVPIYRDHHTWRSRAVDLLAAV